MCAGVQGLQGVPGLIYKEEEKTPREICGGILQTLHPCTNWEVFPYT